LPKMKILMITPFHKQIRGNAVTAARICSGLQKLGWRIDLCSLEERRILEVFCKKEDNTDSYSPYYARYGMIHGFHAVHISRILHEVEELKELPLLLTMTGTDIHNLREGEDTAVIHAALNHATAITVFNADFISFLSGTCPAWGAKTNLITQGVALKEGKPLLRQDLGLSEKELVFILPSGLRAIKNIDMAVDAINILLKSDHKKKVKLIIAGPALEENYAERLLRRFELSPEIKYLGAINHHDIKPLLQLADVVINCSLSEGQPQAALEAMSLGKPCILTAILTLLKTTEKEYMCRIQKIWLQPWTFT